MCGIAGILSNKNIHIDSSIIESMIESISHRGPDNQDYQKIVLKDSQLLLGHARLSILDLSEDGNQPMRFNNQTIVYNGEVYNFQEIKNELNTLGYTFQTNTDTEVILKAIEYWGDNALHKFNGMFSFCIYDGNKNTLKLYRDRAGVKPLYLYQSKDFIAFSSEIKSFLNCPLFPKQISKDGISSFFAYGYIPEPHSIIENVQKVRAGHIYKINLSDLKVETEKYWDVQNLYERKKLDLDLKEILEHTETLLQSACEYRMVSDVPVGIFLSGGYDSVAVTTLLQRNSEKKLKTFTVGFENSIFDESNYAGEISKYLGTDHHQIEFNSSTAKELMGEMFNYFDEPFGDMSALPTMLVSKLAREHVTVSLSADGGDEIFGGYIKYNNIIERQKQLEILPLYIRQLISKFGISVIWEFQNKIPRKDFSRIERFLKNLSSSNSEFLQNSSRIFTDFDLKRLLDYHPETAPKSNFSKISHLDDIDELMYLDYKTYQQDNILVKVDRATMHCSLEGREPLLDHRLVDFLSQIEPTKKLQNNSNKYLLKTIVHQYIPKNLMDRPKKGFSFPLSDFLNDQFKDYVDYYLDDRKINNLEFINADYVRMIKTGFFRGNQLYTKKLWLLLIYSMWYEKWILR